MKIFRAGSVWKISGVIDEHADFSVLLAEQAPLTLDFSEVERVNSVGIRTWMRFMTQWGDKDLIYVACPAVVVDQLSIIPALMGIKRRAAMVQSADISFECSQCGHQEDRSLDRSAVHPNPDSARLSPQCPSCGRTLKMISPDSVSIFLPRT
jgi:hypothetical protein